MDEAAWEKAKSFHGHQCPGLAIGFKACEAAYREMAIAADADEELVCVAENDACGVDAVQALLSCTFGKGNLIYRGTGKQAFSFFARTSGKKLRVCLRPGAIRGESREERMEAILAAPLEELFSFSSPPFPLPEKARLFETVLCSKCGEGVAEHMIRLENGQPVCLDCRTKYTRGW